MYRVPGARRIIEEEIRVARLYRIMEPGDSGRGTRESPENAKQRLVQFFPVSGGLRTVAVGDVVDVK